MGKANIETFNDGGEWKSRRQGATRAFVVGGTKAEQQAQGREAAKRDGVEHLIKNLGGTIGQKNSYGEDLHPPRGRPPQVRPSSGFFLARPKFDPSVVDYVGGGIFGVVRNASYSYGYVNRRGVDLRQGEASLVALERFNEM